MKELEYKFLIAIYYGNRKQKLKVNCRHAANQTITSTFGCISIAPVLLKEPVAGNCLLHEVVSFMAILFANECRKCKFIKQPFYPNPLPSAFL
ncbi:hypothetical protein [Parapedobacter tibetensis]|uniref:hypothetical protein n=1 Tax=Parapedobacter tibetensis TaxID=2972951 RepID=UPI00214DB09B|nr:hypothetical protein [Parapedobacter tibetensis]